MRSEGYGTWFVCVCVCLSIRLLSRATRPRNSDTNGFIATLASFFKKAIFVCSEVMA